MSNTIRTIRIGASVVALIAIVFVVTGNISAQQQRDRDVAGMRQLQQWGIALNLYLIENENQLPDVGTTPITKEQKRAWFNILPPYISETPLADLPPGSRPRPGVASIWIRPGTKPVRIWDSETFYFNYGMNRFLQPQDGLRSFRIFEVMMPGSVIFLAPVDGYVPSSDPESLALPGNRTKLTPVLFCDGHVQRLSGDALTAPEALGAPEPSTVVSWFKQ